MSVETCQFWLVLPIIMIIKVWPREKDMLQFHVFDNFLTKQGVLGNY